ncbi:tRNA 2-selenouridine(34) synthase MnmH [Rubritalea tangerina]|uniref:tRNA 2-selenouridine(34) synthase MnmH n=1 Tax=Rubritalea tangerina TaxID=430798 RepID=A0ABW4ZB91_9BACT
MHYIESISLPLELNDFSEIIDVRSPSEFAVDHIPGATNLPVLSDEERMRVGKLYKQSPFEARRLGAALISVNAGNHLLNHLSGKPADYTPLLYCWRGGMRSRSFTHILSSIGWEAKVLDGGYRAFRKFLVEDLAQQLNAPSLKIVVLSGLTGVGKTRMLQALKNCGQQILDLEHLANHKGSLLGDPTTGCQPSQKEFETKLWHTLSNFDQSQIIWTEAESNRIGKVHCPPALWQKLSSATVVQLELPVEERIRLLKQDYPHFSDSPESLIELLQALRRLRGNQQVDQWQDAIKNNDWDAFLRSILIDHYDLSYRQPGEEGSIYQAPKHALPIKSILEEDFLDGANQLIKQF